MIFLNFIQPLPNIQQKTLSNEENAILKPHSGLSLNDIDLHAKYAFFNSKNLSDIMQKQLNIDDILICFLKIEKSEKVSFEHYLFAAIFEIKFFFNSKQDLDIWLETGSIHLPKQNIDLNGWVLCNKIYLELKNPPLFTNFHFRNFFKRQEDKKPFLVITESQVNQFMDLAGQPPLQELLDSNKV